MQENGKEQPEPGSYRQRRYRLQVDTDKSSLATFNVTVNESDLLIRAADISLQSFAREQLIYYRHQLESFLGQFPEVRFQLCPFNIPEHAIIPEIVSRMIAAGKQAGVGPMAAVAGAIAESVGHDLLTLSPMVMVENGGDIFLAGASAYTVGIFAGQSPFSGKLGIRISRPERRSFLPGSVLHHQRWDIPSVWEWLMLFVFMLILQPLLIHWQLPWAIR
ncbi:MAG: hypothetical protein GWP07_06645 [Xanthomonadaceae bacterium]|nr:hypothetical protein [Xanthomonadaceae bacterium]